MAGLQCTEILSLLDLENTLKCPVCFELPSGHIYSCNSGHHLCRACRESLCSCPICQCGLSLCRNFVVEELIARYEFIKETIEYGQAIENQENGQTAETQENGETPESQESIFDFSVSDFSTVVKTTGFVDKTLMIRDVFKSSSQILITAPPRFGKSTNLNMVKRFVEISDLNRYNQPVDHHNETENYRLFKDNNLNICNYDEVFNEHFGKYPVIYTDWKALGWISDFNSMLDIFRRIIVETFTFHICLVDNLIHQFMTNDLDIINIKKYFCQQSIKDMDINDLVCSFVNLSRVLYRHFNKKVFVLIDNYDAFVNSILFKKQNLGNENYMLKIISFINKVIYNLLHNNHCVGRAILTGVFPLTGDGFALHGTNIDCYSFLDNHPFCKYYGLTPAELDKVLDKLGKNDREKLEIKKIITEYYSCYTAGKPNIQIYSIWSILQYLHKRRVQSSWCNHECISSLKSALFDNKLIQYKMGQLLCGDILQLDVLQPLSTGDVKLNTDSRMDRAFLLFHHLGCFSINKVLGRGCVDLTIPNEEIKYELGRLLLEANYIHGFYDNMKQVWSTIDSFQPNSTDLNKMFTPFVETLRAASCSRLIKLSIPHYLSSLYLGLLTTSECRQTVTQRLGPDGLMVIVIRNKHNVAICLTAEEDTSLNRTDETMCKTAENAHKNITDNSYEDEVFGRYDNLCGKVLVAIGYRISKTYCSSYTFDISITYSYKFQNGDNLQNFKTL